MIHLRNNFIVGLVYFALAQLGLLLSLPPNVSSVFWPAAGFALFAVLHLGFRIWPGLLLGVFLYKYLNYIDERFLVYDDFRPVLSIVLLSFAPVLQALIGGLVLKKLVGYPSALEKHHEILTLLFVGGILCSLISPVLSVGILYVFGDIAFSGVFSSFLIWWIGDVLGTVAVLPVLILIFMPKKFSSVERVAIVLPPVIITMLIIVMLFSYFKYNIALEKGESFQHRAQSFKEKIEGKMASYTHILHMLENYYDVSTYVNRQDFYKFSRQFLLKHTEVKAVTWAPKVKRSEIEGYQIEAKSGGFDFRVKGLRHDGTLTFIPKVKDVYFPVFYVEPFKENKAIFGLDLAFDTKHEDELIYAAETGNLVMSDEVWRFHESQETKTEFLMVTPVYYQDALVLQNQSLSENLLGYIGVIFDMNSLLADIEREMLPFGMVMHLIDVSEDGAGYGIYRSKHVDGGYKAEEDRSIPRLAERIKLANRTWEIHIHQLQSLSPKSVPILIVVTLVGGSAFIVLLLVLLFTITGISNATRREIQRRTKELQESKNRFDLAVEGANDGIWDWNIETDEMYYAPHYRELLGYKGDDYISFPNVYGSFFSHLHEDDRSDVAIALQEHMEDGTPFDIEYRLRHLTGEYRNFHARGAMIRNQHGRAVRMAGSITDVTQRIRGQQEIEEARHQAEAATKAKGDFLASVSHEIRTPLNGIIGTADLLASLKVQGEELRCVETIQSSGRVLLALLNDVLDYSKIEAGKLALNEEPVHLRKILEELNGLFSAMVGKHNLTMEMLLPDDLPDLVSCDEVKFRQVLQNLISNAIKFTDYGGIILKAEVLDHDVVSARLRFSVTDTGVGIPASEQGNIFDNFTQLEVGGKSIKGTGLGLSICRSIVEMMGGEINVESTENTGTTFWFTVDFETLEEGEFETAETEDVMLEKVHAHILVVEDVHANIFVIEHMLKLLGAEIDIVEDGLTAVQVAEQKDFDLIFMDCNLPKLSGYGASRRIRNKLKSDDLPIIALTANALSGDKRKCLNAGMNDFLAKPIKMKKLHRILAKWIPDLVVKQQQEQENITNVVKLHKEKESVFLTRVNKEYKDQASVILDVSIKDAEEFLNDLLIANAKNNAEDMQFAAHSLKAVFKGIYVDSLIDQARTIEALAQNEGVSFDEVMLLIKKMQMDFSKVKEIIKIKSAS